MTGCLNVFHNEVTCQAAGVSPCFGCRQDIDVLANVPPRREFERDEERPKWLT